MSQKQKAEDGDMVAVVKACTVAKADAEAEYLRYGEIARFALRNDQGALKKLGLLTSLPNIHAKRIAQIRQFYANALIDPARTRLTFPHKFQPQVQRRAYACKVALRRLASARVGGLRLSSRAFRHQAATSIDNC